MPKLNNNDFDADKVSKHISYTQHWLEKAEKDFKTHQYTNGGMILNLARAELTTAWEEFSQLRRQVSNIPEKAKTNWKPLTSVGLLASGFFIALFITRFSGANLPGEPSPTNLTTPVVVFEQTQPIADESSSVIEVIPENEPAETLAQSEESIETPELNTAPEAAANIDQQNIVESAPEEKPIIKKTVRNAASPDASAGSDKVKTIAPEADITDLSVTTMQPELSSKKADSTTKSTIEKRELEQSEVIELFNTARKSLYE